MENYWSQALHDDKSFIEYTVHVLNEEWPRSISARKHMLEKSNEKFPYSLILLEKENADKINVIGHSRLCQVHGKKDACFVESVVVSKSKRGMGFGRILMKESEKHAKRLGINTVYLTTHDKQDFYGHVGYSYCEPVLSFGGAANLIPDSLADSLFGKLKVSTPENSNRTHSLVSSAGKAFSTNKSHLKESQNACDVKDDSQISNDKTHLADKVSSPKSQIAISLPPSVPSPPVHQFSPQPVPPPPPPPPPAIRVKKDTIAQRFTGQVYWMKKSIVES